MALRRNSEALVIVRVLERVYAFIMTLCEAHPIPYSDDCIKSVRNIISKTFKHFSLPTHSNALMSPWENECRTCFYGVAKRTILWYDANRFCGDIRTNDEFFGFPIVRPHHCIILIMEELLYAIWNHHTVLNKVKDTSHYSANDEALWHRSWAVERMFLRNW